MSRCPSLQGVPWTSNHPRRVIFWRRGRCFSWIPSVLEQWLWNQARQPPREGVSLRNHRRKTLLAPRRTSWFSVPSFSGVPGEFLVPCMWSVSPLLTHTLTARGPHSASTGTIHWGYIYLKPYKHKFVDRITIIIEQHALGRGYETHETFLFGTQWITIVIQYIVRIKILSFGEIVKNKRIKNHSIWIWPVFINKRIRIIRICGIWRWWQGENKEKKT